PPAAAAAHAPNRASTAATAGPAQLPPALLRPLRRLRPAHVRQDPPRPRLLLLLPGQQQRRPTPPLPQPSQGHLRPRRRPPRRRRLRDHPTCLRTRPPPPLPHR